MRSKIKDFLSSPCFPVRPRIAFSVPVRTKPEEEKLIKKIVNFRLFFKSQSQALVLNS